MAAINWKNGVNGDWSTASDWMGGRIPGAADDVTIAAAGTYTVTINAAEAAHSLTVNAAHATVSDSATLTLGGTLAVQAGIFSLAGSGDIVGGTISTSGSGTFLCNGGTLTGTTYQGVLSLGASGSSVSLQGADSFTGAGGTGTGSITLGSSGDAIYAIDNLTLDNATVTVGAASAYDYIYLESVNSNADTLTFGSHLNFVQSGAGNQTTINLYSYVVTSGTFVNQGTITASAKNGLLTIYGPSGYGTFVNQGVINVSNGDTVSLATNATSSTLGSFTTTSGGVFRLQGGYTLSNAGATLAVSSGAQLTLAGTVTGGTITDAGGGLVSLGGTLSGVTYQGTLNLAANTSVEVANGLVGSSTGSATTINDIGSGSYIYADDVQTLDYATINLGNASTSTLYEQAVNTAWATLTLGNHLTVAAAGTSARIYVDQQNIGNTLINKGTISDGVHNGVLTIYGYYAGDSFINQGLLSASNGGTISLQTNVTSTGLGSFATATGGAVRLEGGYTLSNAGATLALGTGSQLTLAGAIQGGTVSDSGGGLVSQGGTLSGVTYQGTLNVAANAGVYITNGLNVVSGGAAGVINDSASNSNLYFYDTQTLDNATLNIGNAGTSYLYLYEDTGSPATLTLGSHLSLTQAGQYAQIAIDPQGIGGNALVNEGTITAGTKNGTLSINGYAGDTFTNQGSLAVSNGDSLVLSTNVTTAGLGAFSTSGGGAIVLSSGHTLSNAGATLALGTGSQLTLAGTIQGGIVSDSGGGLVSQNGTLSGVTYQGTLSLAANMELNITGGLNVVSGGSIGIINDNASGSALSFYDTQTLDNATLNIGSAGTSYLYFYEDTGSPATLTLGSHLALTQAGQYAQVYIDLQNAGNALISKATITAGVKNGTLSINGYYAGDTFTNQGSLVASNSCSLVLNTNVTTAGLGAFSTISGGAVVLSSGYTLSNTGATLALGTGSQLTLAGTIQGGTISDSGGGLVSQNGTLSGVTYQGTLNVGTSTHLSVVGGLNVVSSGSTGIINDTGSGSLLYFYDTQTLDNATLNLGNAGTSYLYLYEDTGSPATLTLGSHLALTQTGQYAQIDIDPQGIGGNALINRGTITAAARNGALSIYGQYTGDTFTNQGSLVASNGDSLALYTNVTTAGLGAFSTSGGGAIVLSSGYTLSNAGATLALSTGSQLTLGGTIQGGTVSDSGGGLVSQTGTLDGVTYLGTLNIASGASLHVANGLNVVSGGAGGVINDNANGSNLSFDDTQSLDNATLTLGATVGNAYLDVYAYNNPTATLTLGSHLTLNAGKFAQIREQDSGDALINQGTITAGVNGGSLDIYAYYANGSFTNQGSLIATNNDTILFDTNITTAGLGAFSTSGGGAVELDSGYTLGNTGATLALSTGSQLTLVGTIQGGTVADSGGGLVSQGGTLSGVTYQGTLNVTNLTVTNGLTVQTGGGAGVINDTGSGSNLTLYDTQTLDRAALNIGNNAGTSVLYLYEDTGKPVTLTLGSHLALTETGKNAQINIDPQGIGGNALVNQGTISAATNGGTLLLYGQYAKDSLTSTGSLVATGGGTLDFSNVGTFKNVAGGTLTAGYYEADAHSTLQITNNLSITTDAATIVLSGAGSVFESTKTSNSTQVTLDKSLTTIASTGTLALLAGRSFAASGAFTDAGLLQLGGGTFSTTGTTSGLTVSAGGRLAGFGTVAPALADNGTVEATSGTLVLAGAVTGTGALQVDSGATLEIKTSTASGETIAFAGQGGTLLLDQPASAASPIAGFAAGDTVGLGTLTATSATITGQTLSITLSGGSVINETLVGATAGERVGVSANGHGVVDYRFAQANLTPTTLNFGNHHVGDAVSSAVTLTNTAPADGYSEKLDGTAAGATGAASVSGGFTGLAAGQSDGTDIQVGLNTSTSGAVSGTGTVSLSTDGAGTDGGAPVAIGTQSFAVSGAVFAYAAPTLSTSTINLGAARVGDATTGTTLTVGDGGSANPYQESLDYTLAAPAGFNGTASGTVASGGSGTATVSLATGTAGDFSGTQLTVGFTSDGTAIGDGLGTTALPGQTVTLNGKVYAAAVAQLATTTLNFGVVHVGDTGADTMLSLMLSNGATGALTDVLTGGVGSVSGAFSFSGNLGAGLAAGQSGALGFQINTSGSGSLSGTALLNLLSHDPDLADLALSTGAITLTGAVDTYAVAALAETSGGGTFTQTGNTYTLDLGQVAQGAGAVTVGLEALNAATGLADLLDGTLTASGSGAFTVSGLGSFSGLGAGQADMMPQITLSTSAAGTFTETIVLTSEGTNAGGYAGALPSETLTITGTIVASQTGQTYVLTKKAVTINAGSGNDTFVAATATLVAGDHLDGGGGSNTLSLTGGGTFNLATPASLADIQVVAAQEGQAAGGGQPSTLQTITLRAGLDAMVNVAAASLNGSDPNGAAITINGAANADVINLGGGTDTVLNLDANETVLAGTGTDLVRAVIASAGAAVVGQSSGATTLELTSGGTATLNAADTHLTVQLDAATTLHLGAMGFITVVGGKGTDSLYAGGANQVLEGGGGTNSLFSAAGGGDIFLDTTKNIATDTVGGWTTGDMLDITDMNPSTAHITGYKGGKLSVTDGTHKASIAFTGSLSAGNFVVLGTDGHGGTLIGYHG